MEGTYDAIRRHANNDLAAIRQRLDSGRRIGVNETHKLANIAEALTRTIENMDRIESRRPYSDTNMGYGVDARRRGIRSDMRTTVDDAMDAINKILPRIVDDYDADDDAEMRQGVPGTGPYSNPRLRRRGGRKGIGRRRYEMDRYEADDMDDDTYDDVEDRRGGRRRRDSRGRFVRGDYDRYDNDRMTDDHERYTHDAVTRAAADAAAATARHMANPRAIYPGTPVMPRADRYTRYEDDTYHHPDRSDDTADDRSRRPGPRE